MNDTRLTLTAPIELQAAAGDKPRRLRIVGYTGGEMSVAGFGPLVVTLDGLELVRPLPVLDSHKDELDALIAQGEPAVTAGQLVITATLLPGTAAERVVTLLQAGAALQASIAVEILQQRFLRSGETQTVNGKEVTAGPRGLLILEKSRLRETSILPAGADASTSVSIAAQRAAGVSMDTLPVPTTTPTPTPAALTADVAAAVQQERARLGEIERITAGLSLGGAMQQHLDSLKARAISGEITVDTPRAGALDLLRASRPVLHSIPGAFGPHNHAQSAQHLAAALMVRAGFERAAEHQFGAVTMEQSRPLHRQSFVDLCKAALVIDGKDIPQTREGMIRAALSTSSMPTALGSSAEKVLVAAYTQAPAPWRLFAAVRSAANFKTQTGVRGSFFGDLLETGAGGEVKHGSIGEETYTWQVGQYAKQLQIDRKDMVNDDLGVFADVLPSFARAAARTLNDLVATTLLSGSAAFFTSGRKNFITGSTTTLLTDGVGLTKGLQTFRQMSDAEGNLLDLVPGCLLVPPELEYNAKLLVGSASVMVPDTDGGAQGAPFADLCSVAVDARLSDSNYTGFSTTAWYLFSTPENAAVVVGFLDGAQAPTLETFGLDSDINHLAFGFRVYHDFGVALADFRAAIKSKGAA